MFVTKVFGVLALAVLALSASMPQSGNSKPRMMTWEQHRADLATSGWIIIQQRNDVDDTKNLFSDSTWKAYKKGFWNLNINDTKFDNRKDAGYWMGLEKMHQMTKKGRWQLLTSYEFDKNKPHTTNGGPRPSSSSPIRISQLETSSCHYLDVTSAAARALDYFRSTQEGGVILRFSTAPTHCVGSSRSDWWKSLLPTSNHDSPRQRAFSLPPPPPQRLIWMKEEIFSAVDCCLRHFSEMRIDFHALVLCFHGDD